MGDHLSSAFVGRDRELATLGGWLADAGQGRGRVVLLAGEPGIGKTRLLAELAERAARGGWRVLMGRATEPEGMPPYLPFAEALRAHIRTCPPERLAAQLGAGAAAVAAVVPDLPRHLAQGSAAPTAGVEAGAAPDRYRVFEAVCDFLAAIARVGGEEGESRPRPPVAGERPGAQGETPGRLLLILDDLHWADTPSLRLLQHLGRRQAGASVGRLMVAGAYWNTEVGRTHPLTTLVAALGREGVLELLPLTALSAAECTALIATASGRAPAPAVAEALYRATAGNPLFLGEMVRHFQAEGRDLGDPAAGVADWRVPDGLRALIAARLGRLGEHAHRLLQAAAVLGDGVRFDVLAHVCGDEPLPLLDALDEALAAGLLREEGEGYSVGHALIRQALVQDLSLPRRQRLHRLAVEAFETLYACDQTPHLGTLALHARLAGPSMAGPALAYARRAGEAALAVYALEEAVRHWQTALALGPLDAEERFELLLKLGYAQAQAGQQEAANQTIAAAAGLARQRGDARWLARAAITSFTPYVFVVELDPARVQLFEEAAARLTDDEPVLRARVLAGLARALHWSGDPARLDRLSAEALALARRGGDATALAEALNARHSELGGPEHVVERRALSAELIRVAEAAGRPELQCLGRVRQMRDAIEQSDGAAFDAQLAALARQAAELRWPMFEWQTAACRAVRALLTGSFDEADRLIHQALLLERQVRQHGADSAYLSQVSVLRAEREGPERALAVLQEAVARYPVVPFFRAAAVWALGACGRSAEAREAFDELAVDRFAGLRRDPLNLLTGLGYLAELSALLGDRGRARVLYDLLLPHAGLTVCAGLLVFIRGPIAHELGILAAVLRRWDDAERHFTDALAVGERLGARPAVARTQYEYAAMLLARGRPGDAAHAQALRATALEAARRMDMAPLAEQIERPAPARPGPVAGRAGDDTPLPDGLTAREAEILRLLASGMTSKQIAATLVLALPTVRRHVANLYAKIGAHGRADATVYALRHGLGPAAASERPGGTRPR